MPKPRKQASKGLYPRTIVAYHPGSNAIHYPISKEDRKNGLPGETTEELKRRGFWIFDSRLEFRVFERIQVYARKYVVARHQPITLLPATREYPAICWKVDFRIGSEEDIDLSTADKKTLNPPLLIEVKGFETDDYRLRLALFKRFRSERLEIIKHLGECDRIASAIAEIEMSMD